MPVTYNDWRDNDAALGDDATRVTRRYIAVFQDPRGYTPPGVLEAAPPVGPRPPTIHSVVLAEDYAALAEALRELLEAGNAEETARRSRAWERDVVQPNDVYLAEERLACAREQAKAALQAALGEEGTHG